jgi:hypothetical protein
LVRLILFLDNLFPDLIIRLFIFDNLLFDLEIIVLLDFLCLNLIIIFLLNLFCSHIWLRFLRFWLRLGFRLVLLWEEGVSSQVWAFQLPLA